MPYQRPTLKELQERIIADIGASTGQTIPTRSVLAVLGKASAAITHGNYGNIEWALKQIFPDTAEVEYLDRWAAIWNVVRKPASYASGGVIFNGVEGSVILSGAIFQTSGIEYQTTESGEIGVSGTINIASEAQTAGEAGNQDSGAILSLVNPISGVESSVIAGINGIDGGADVEDDESLRERLLARIQNPPHGGNENDYIMWAKGISGVTRAWAYENWMGIGTVGVTFVTDDADDIIPTQQVIDDVATYIETVRPLCAEIYVFAPTPKIIDFSIAVAPNTADVKLAVETELRAFITENADPEAVIAPSQISEAISSAQGELSHTLILPNAAVTINQNEIGVFGAITWL